MRQAILIILISVSAWAQSITTPFLNGNKVLPDSSLKAYWKLDEASGTRFDSSTNGNNLTPAANAYGGTGKIAGGVLLDSNLTSYLWITNSNLRFGDSSFTLSCWVYFTNLNNNNFILTKDLQSPAGSREYDLYWSSSTKQFTFAVYRATDSSVALTCTNLGNIQTNSWYFLCATHDAANDLMSLTVNTTTYAKATGGALQAGSNANFEIGAAAFGGALNNAKGIIDEVGVWNRVLSTNEIAFLYNNGAGSTPNFGRPLFGGEIVDSAWQSQNVAFDASSPTPGLIWQTYGIAAGNGKYFTAWYAPNFTNVVAEVTNNLWTVASVPFYGGNSNSLVQGDANHSYASMVTDTNGIIHVVYGAHISNLFYRRGTVSNSALTWTSETTISPKSSYPAILCSSNNTLFVFYRGSTNYSYRTLSMKTSTDGGTNWSAENIIIDSQDENLWTYHGVMTMARDSRGTIYLPWTWRTNTASNISQDYTNVYLASSTNAGVTWNNFNAGTVTLPIHTDTAIAIITNRAVAPIMTTCDTNNQPFTLTSISSDSGYWTNSTLLITSSAGTRALPLSNYYSTPGLLIDTNNTFTVIGAVSNSGNLNLWKSISNDKGTNWTSAQMTFGSNSPLTISVIDSVRTRGNQAFIWTDASGVLRYGVRR